MITFRLVSESCGSPQFGQNVVVSSTSVPQLSHVGMAVVDEMYEHHINPFICAINDMTTPVG